MVDFKLPPPDEYLSLTPEERIKKFYMIGDEGNFMTPLTQSHLRLLKAEQTSPTTGRVVFELQNPSYWSNWSNNMHGGAQASILDYVTSTALVTIARKDFWYSAGVSRTINMTYLRPAPVGETLLAEGEVVHVGKNLAFVRGVIRRKNDGAIISTCEHNKANTDKMLLAKL